jgi:predicted rRNA methylase YqxC with S4 and FtsJ domains
VINEVAESADELGLAPQHVIRSPIAGGDGNVEFLLHLRSGGRTSNLEPAIAEAVRV